MGGKEQAFIQQQLNLPVFSMDHINTLRESTVQMYGNFTSWCEFFYSVKQDGLSEYRGSNNSLASAVYLWCHNNHWRNRISSCIA